MFVEAKRLLKLTLGPVLILLAMFSAGAWGEELARSSVNMTPGVTDVGNKIYDLHQQIMIISTVIGVLVFGVMLYSIWAHRKSRGAVASNFHESTKVELAWTIIPIFILIYMGYQATITLKDIYNFEDAEIDIVITGYQWKWKYEYLDENGENVSFFSNLKTAQSEINNAEAKGEHYLLEVDEPIYIPVDTKVRFLITANDVIHSWWVPELAVKKDAIPGFINEAWTLANKTGIYRGQCAELCGKDHGFMPVVVNVVEQAEYDEWLANKQREAAEIKELMAQNFNLDQLMERGKAVYDRNCLACHGANGEGGVGTAIKGSAIATGPVDGHLEIAIKGVPGTAMQAFGGQLNDVDMAAVITYQRNAFGNNMGDKVQPIDVFNHKKG